MEVKNFARRGGQGNKIEVVQENRGFGAKDNEPEIEGLGGNTARTCGALTAGFPLLPF
jgi:hypothetical protein